MMAPRTPHRTARGPLRITHRDMAELALAMDRMTPLERLTSFTAHEVRNPLAAIRAMIELALATSDPDHRHALLSRVIHSIDDLSQFLTELASLADVRQSMLVPLDVRAVIDDVIRLFAVQAELLNVRIAVRSPRALSPVWGNAPLLRHAVMNLIKNSIEAMPGGGSVTVAVKQLEERNTVCVVIRDTGAGIPKERQARLFSGVPDGRRGRGIGLPFVHRVITDVHRGTLRFESTVGVGTTFFVELLPATTASPPDGAP